MRCPEPPPLMPGFPLSPSLTPLQQPRSPTPLYPWLPSAPTASVLYGSPILFASIWTVGESKATVIIMGSFGSGADLGGIKVLRAVGGGAPCLAGSIV